MLRRWGKRAGYTLLGGFFVYLAWTGTHTSLPKDAPRLYVNEAGDNLQLTLASAINGAKESVHLAIYSLTDRPTIAALHQAAERGAEVFVLYDKHHKSDRLQNQLGEKVTSIRRKMGGLMHQKILVIDGHQVWIGSANCTPESLRIHGNLVVGFDCPTMGHVLIENITERRTRAPPPLTNHNYSAGGQHLELYLPRHDKDSLDRLCSLLDTAQKSLRVAMFTFTHPRLTQCVIDAHNRGLDVAVALDKRQASGCGKVAHEALLNAKVPVTLSEGPGLLHYKVAVIDQRILVAGSTNWTRSAFSRNEECLLILHDLQPKQIRRLTRLPSQEMS